MTGHFGQMTKMTGQSTKLTDGQMTGKLTGRSFNNSTFITKKYEKSEK